MVNFLEKKTTNKDLELYKFPLCLWKTKFARICFHGVTIIIIVEQKIQKKNMIKKKYVENKNETVKKNGKVFVKISV